MGAAARAGKEVIRGEPMGIKVAVIKHAGGRLEPLIAETPKGASNDALRQKR